MTTRAMRGLALSGLALLAFGGLPDGSPLTAQTGTKTTKKTVATGKTKEAKASPAQMQELELRARKAREQFLRDSLQLALDYEEAGLLEEARSLLQTLQRVDEDLPGVKEKIQQIGETLIAKNDTTLDIDVSKGFTEAPVAAVQKGKPFRVKARGTYRFAAQATLGPAGFPAGDLSKGEMAGGAGCGALIAVIIPIDDRGRPGKPGAPIEIGVEKEITPQQNGLLFFSVNAPPDHKCSGKLTLELSGFLQSAQSPKP